MAQVSFGLELDVYDFCSPELKASLDGPRAAFKAHQDLLLEMKKAVKNADGQVGAGKGIGALGGRQALVPGGWGIRVGWGTAGSDFQVFPSLRATLYRTDR